MSVPSRNTGMRELIVSQGAVSPSVGEITLAGALLSGDNRVWSTAIGADATRLNSLLKRGYATVEASPTPGPLHVRTAAEADAAT